VAVLRCAAADRTGYLAGRLAITTWPDAWRFQPLLYVDTDIVFDAPVAPMLRAIARSSRISAPVEPKEALATSVFVGSTLLSEDGCDPGTKLGFNSGTLGIPNLALQGKSLDLIARIMNNHASIFGRAALPFIDQPIANYVSFKVADFDTALITPFVRLSNETADPAGRTGLVHYCWVGGEARRVDVMRDYLRRLGLSPPDAQEQQPAPVQPATSDIVTGPLVELQPLTAGFLS
jgi:hypothetical protein